MPELNKYYFLIKLKKDYPKILTCLLPAVAVIVLIHTVYTDNPNYLKWFGGMCWGPRYFTEVLPLLIIYLGISIIELKKLIDSRKQKNILSAILFSSIILLSIFSIYTQYVGAFYYKGYWDTHPKYIGENPTRVWDLYENPIFVEVKTGTIPLQHIKYISTWIQRLASVFNYKLVILYNWYDIESWQNVSTQWTSNNATILIYSPIDKGSNISFNIRSFYEPRTLQVYMNDKLTHEENIEKNISIIEMSIKLYKGKNILRFFTPEGCQRPIDIPQLNNKDSRCLSFAFQNITLY